MAATLDTIAAAILAALQTTLTTASTPGPFAQAVIYAGDTTRDKGVESKTFGITPAAMLAFESELPEVAIETAAQGVISTVLRSTWRVFIVVNDASGNVAASAKVFACASATKAALTGLRIPGLYQQERLRFVDIRAAYVKNGVYIYLARFSALAEQVSSNASATPSQPLEQVVANVNSAPDTNPANATPITHLTATTT